MATAPKMPRDETIEILRRIEPALSHQADTLKSIQLDLAKLDDRLRCVEGDGRELKGRVSQLPTLIQIVGAVSGINAAIIALGFALAKLVH